MSRRAPRMLERARTWKPSAETLDRHMKYQRCPFKSKDMQRADKERVDWHRFAEVKVKYRWGNCTQKQPLSCSSERQHWSLRVYLCREIKGKYKIFRWVREIETEGDGKTLTTGPQLPFRIPRSLWEWEKNRTSLRSKCWLILGLVFALLLCSRNGVP